MALVRTYNLLEAKIELVDWKQWEDEGTQSVSQSVCPTACKRTCLPCLHLIAGCCLCLFWKEGLWLPNRWANKEVSAQPPLNQPQCFFGEFFSRTRAPSWQHQQQLKPSRLTEDWLTWASCRIQLLTNVPMIMIVLILLVTIEMLLGYPSLFYLVVPQCLG